MRFFAISFLLFLPTLGLAAESECTSILVENADGASIVIPATGEKRELEIDDSIAKGDAIATGKEAWVDLRLCDGSGLRVGAKSKMTFEEAFSTSEQGWTAWAFDLLKGTLLATVAGQEKGEKVKLRVRTPTAALGVRGTEFLVDAIGGDDTLVQTMEGEVLVGKREDYETLAKPDFKSFQGRFEALKNERQSRVKNGQAPEKPVPFKLAEARQQRKELFRNPLNRIAPEQARDGLEKARTRREEKQENRKEQREEKLENRKEQREEKQENRKEQREEKQERHREPGEDKQDNRKEQREEKREERKERREERPEQRERSREGSDGDRSNAKGFQNFQERFDKQQAEGGGRRGGGQNQGGQAPGSGQGQGPMQGQGGNRKKGPFGGQGMGQGQGPLQGMGQRNKGGFQGGPDGGQGGGRRGGGGGGGGRRR